MEMTACGASSLFFAAAGDFVPVLGVFPGCFVAAENFVPVLGAFPGRFVAVGVFCPGFRDVSGTFCCTRGILSRKWVRNEDVLCRGCVTFGKGMIFL